MTTTVSVDVPADGVIWQAVCDRCGASYGVMHADEAGAPHPRFCVFCAARAGFSIAPGSRRAATF